MAITIRDAAQIDIEQMLPLLEHLFAIEADFKFDNQVQTRGLTLMLDDCGKHSAIKVACLDDRIIGMCTVQTRISTAQGKYSAVVEDLVVDKAYRCKGIGVLLLTAVEDWARMREITSIQLLADKNNHTALEFYKGQAWESTALVCLVKTL